VMKIQVVVFWVVILCSDVVGYQQFGGSCCPQLHKTVDYDLKGGSNRRTKKTAQ
jgi:hypothetical protein